MRGIIGLQPWPSGRKRWGSQVHLGAVRQTQMTSGSAGVGEAGRGQAEVSLVLCRGKESVLGQSGGSYHQLYPLPPHDQATARGGGVVQRGPGALSNLCIWPSGVRRNWGTSQERSRSMRVQDGGCLPWGRPVWGICGRPSCDVGCKTGWWGGAGCI